MRYEHKYVVENFHAFEVEHLVRMHPAGFRKAFPDRQVNNIYFDTADFSTFQHNLMGISKRHKYRIRWYGNPIETVRNIRLETKIKDNQLGRKEWEDREVEDWNSLINLIPNLNWTKELQLQPALLNAYQRAYYSTFNGKFRITVDHRLQFGPFNSSFPRLVHELPHKVILELKYDQALEHEADRITQYIPFRIDKHSKYVTGTSLIMY
ncbi:MAG: VTC domain-containing protein [Saprospiraceae bacterium]|nr:MAG: VTC domain-containing protein [Saprospiraceae bacterium]